MPKETNNTIRLSQAAKEFNVNVKAIREFLAKRGFLVDSSPNAKLTADMYDLLVKEFQGEKAVMDLTKKLGNLYYKGGSIAIDSAIKKQKVITDNHIKEKTNTIPKKEKETRK